MKRLTMTWMVAAACGGGGGGADGDTGGSSTGEATTGGSSDTSADSSGGTSAATSGESSGDSSSGGGEETGGVDPRPILERDPIVSHACSEVRPMTLFPGNGWSRVESLAVHGGEFKLVRSGDSLEITEIALDATLGASTPLDTTSFAFHGATMAAFSAGIAVAWTHYADDERVRVAVLDSDLDFIADPFSVDASASSSTRVAAVVAGGPGFTVFYGNWSGDGNGTLFRLVFDAEGQAVGSPVAVASLGLTYGYPRASAVPTDDGGHALVYVVGAELTSEVFFVVLDESGEPQFEPRRISRAGGDGWSSDLDLGAHPSILSVGDGYWATFTEGQRNEELMQGHRTVMLARLDAAGNAQLHTLQEVDEGTELRWPSLAMLEDRVALSWTSGTIIWICAGCVTDYDLNFVLLDPDAIVPASEVVTQLHTNNGITSPILAISGGDVLTGSSLDFHALTRPASGAVHCGTPD